MTTLLEAVHAWQLQSWLAHPSYDYLHPDCYWKISSGHPYQGLYRGKYLLDSHTRHLTNTYPLWKEVVQEVIGSQIGGIVIGNYLFTYEPNGHYHTAHFAHFSRIKQGQIIDVRYYMGKVAVSPITWLPSIA